MSMKFGRPRRPYRAEPQHFVWDEITGEWEAVISWCGQNDGWEIKDVAYNPLTKRTIVIERSRRGHTAIWDLAGEWTIDIENGLIEVVGEEQI